MNNFIKNTVFNIDRFCIPIIGEIISGKSTFLNYLSKLNGVLQTDKNITTKIFTIIQHNKNLKQLKIYEVKKIDIYFYKYNFIKGKLIEGNVSSIIKERNEKIKIEKNCSVYEYFLIMEVNIPLFKGENEKYADLF